MPRTPLISRTRRTRYEPAEPLAVRSTAAATVRATAAPPRARSAPKPARDTTARAHPVRLAGRDGRPAGALSATDPARLNRRPTVMARRERIDTGTSTRYARRDARGRFTSSEDVGRASAAGQR